MPDDLSLSQARCLALTAQGFTAKPARSVNNLRKVAAQLNAFQIDSVNVLVRAHYVPAFARLGPYRREDLDRLAYIERELFEYWGHAACLMPISLYPLVRYRMHKHHERTQQYMRSDAGRYMARVYAEVAERGPITAAKLADPGKRSKGWWSWWGSGNGKSALEHLYDAGLVAIAGRRGFERTYDLSERVIPNSALDAPAPPREEAMKQLICLGAKAYGIGTLGDIAGYFNVDDWRDRLPAGPWWAYPKDARRRARPIAKRLVSELVEEKRLLPTRRGVERTGLHVSAGVRWGNGRCSRARHTVRLACLGSCPHRTAFRHEVQDRDVHSAAETDLWILCLPIPASRYSGRAVRSQSGSHTQGSDRAGCVSRTGGGYAPRRSESGLRAPRNAIVARTGPHRGKRAR